MAMMPATTTERPPQAETMPSLLTLARASLESAEHRLPILGAAGCLALLALTFRENLAHFVRIWQTDDNYSHGFLVPPICLYFANLASRRGPVAVRSGVALGVTLIGAALLGRLVTVLLPIDFVGDLSFLVGLTGVCSLVWGGEALRRYWFAFFFLVFMVPLPIALYTRIAMPLQLLVSQLSSLILNVSGIPVLCEGNRMTLPGNVSMFVAEACSGMRQMTGFLALTAAVAYLAPRPGWYRGAVVLSAVPIAMTANVLRVILTALIMYKVNPQFASGAYHTAEGLVMMGVGLGLLRGECWVLDQLRQVVVADGEAAAK